MDFIAHDPWVPYTFWAPIWQSFGLCSSNECFTWNDNEETNKKLIQLDNALQTYDYITNDGTKMECLCVVLSLMSIQMLPVFHCIFYQKNFCQIDSEIIFNMCRIARKTFAATKSTKDNNVKFVG